MKREMKNKKRKGIQLYLAVSLLCLAMLLTGAGVLQQMNEEMEMPFFYDDQACFNPRNPSRGLYIQIEIDEPERIAECAGYLSLFQLTFDLYDYRDCAIPGEKIEQLKVMLETAKANHAKLIIRPAYGFEAYGDNDADSLSVIQTHIAQMAPVLNAYKQQVYCFHAGFYGPWGEWHSSPYLEGEGARGNRVWLVKELLAQLDPAIPVSLRRPSFIREAMEAGCNVERLGFYDDGLLASETEYGTFEEGMRGQEFQWVKENLLAPMGGEMPIQNAFSKSGNANLDFDTLNVSYLNMEYHEDVFRDWKKDQIEGCDAVVYLTSRLGYRLKMSQTNAPGRIGSDNGAQGFEVQILNEGFAPITSGYRLEWVLETTSGELRRVENVQSENNPPLHRVDRGQTYVARLSAHDIGKDVRNIGIRIYDMPEQFVNEDCVRLANREIDYRSGVNFLFTIDEQGNVIKR